MNETNTLQDVANPRLDDAEIAALRKIGTTRRLRDREPLFQVGERRGGFFVVLSGAVEILDPSGEEPATAVCRGRGSSPATLISSAVDARSSARWPVVTRRYSMFPRPTSATSLSSGPPWGRES